MGPDTQHCPARRRLRLLQRASLRPLHFKAHRGGQHCSLPGDFGAREEAPQPLLDQLRDFLLPEFSRHETVFKSNFLSCPEGG